MKVGVCFPDATHNSVRWVFQTIVEGLSAAHEVVFRPPSYTVARDRRQRAMAEAFVSGCDLIVDTWHLDLLQARQRMGSAIPYVAVQLGNLPRGANNIRAMLPYLTSNDTLVVNCTADAEIARKFVPGARIRLLPLAFDDEVFFPLDAEERAALRPKYGFTAEDRILVYAGRCTPSKNLVTLLRVFKALLSLVPNAHLIVAGPTPPRSGISRELGVWPTDFGITVDRLTARLSLPKERLHLLGDVGGERLRELYNLSDVKVNLTLHHDENFGLSQVEAMACGTPVVGTAWGGLKDTIVDGTSGFKVSVAMNGTGVKANWWEAVCKIARLLTNDAGRDALRASCVEHARALYSPAAFGRTLLEIVASSHREADPRPAPVEATPFATEYWKKCAQRPVAMYSPGDRSFELYAELMGSYCGSAPEHLCPCEPLADEHVLCLAWPIHAVNGGFRPDDPHYPFELDIPPAYLETFTAVTAVMRRRPVITVGELRRRVPSTPVFTEALTWMLSVVLLRSRPGSGPLSFEDSAPLDEPLLTVREVDAAHVDFVVFGSASH
jgi:glycosyltransferase involved in cell wall biosynthesis